MSLSGSGRVGDIREIVGGLHTKQEMNRRFGKYGIRSNLETNPLFASVPSGSSLKGTTIDYT